MQNSKLQRIQLALFWILGFLFTLFLSYWAIISEGAWGGMDSYEHYLISRYSWQHPELFLNNWGKPVFTLFHSIVAQFGFTFFKVVNVLWILVASIILKIMLQRIATSVLPFIPLLLFSSPIVLRNAVSGLTEPFTAVLVLLSLLLFLKKKWGIAAILGGFLPYVRSEGYVIAFVMGLFLLSEKRYRYFLYLSVGSLIFNTLGGIITGDWIWIYNSNPYIEAQVLSKGACGSGFLWHYFYQSEFIFGWLFLVLTPLALFSVFKHSIFWKVNKKILFLFASIFLCYFGIHSLIWWKGMMGSCGYTRVMLVILPISIFLLLYLMVYFFENKSKKLYFLSLLIATIIGSTIFFDFGNRTFPLDIDKEQKEMIRVAKWLKKNTLEKDLLYFQFPYLNVIGDINPFNPEKQMKLFHFGFKHAPVGSYVIWDAHFGPNDCHLPLQYLKESQDLIQLTHFVPKEPFKTMNNHDFEVYIFKRIGNKDKRDKPHAY